MNTDRDVFDWAMGGINSSTDYERGAINIFELSCCSCMHEYPHTCIGLHVNCSGSKVIVSCVVLWTKGICSVLHTVRRLTLRYHRRQQEQNNNALNVICNQTKYLKYEKKRRKLHCFQVHHLSPLEPEHQHSTIWNENPLFFNNLSLQLYHLHSCSHFKKSPLIKAFLILCTTWLPPIPSPHLTLSSIKEVADSQWEVWGWF